MWPIILLAVCSAVLGAERSEEAKGRQVVLTQLTLPYGHQPAASSKFVEAVVPPAFRQYPYNFPPVRQNYIHGFQYYPVYPGQAPVPYSYNPEVFYPQQYVPPPYGVIKAENGEGGSGSGYWPSWATNGYNTLSEYFNYPSASPEQPEQQQAEQQQQPENNIGSSAGTTHPTSIPGPGNIKKPQQFQQQFPQQQQPQPAQPHQPQQQLQQQQIKQQQPQQSFVFTNQLYPGFPEYPGYQREGAPIATSNSEAPAQLPQYIFAGQPQFAGPFAAAAPFNTRGGNQDPAKLTAASHGAISNYLFLKNQPQLPAQQQSQQRYENGAAENSVSASKPSSGSGPVVANKRVGQDSISADAKNQRSPLYAQHVSALQVSPDPIANIQGHLIAQASPEAIAAAGVGGMAGAGPTAQAIVGVNGLALTAPKSTAIAGHPDIEVVINSDKKQKKPVAKYSKNKGYHVDYS